MVGATFHMDPLIHLESSEQHRAVRLGAALWWQEQRRQAQERATPKR